MKGNAWERAVKLGEYIAQSKDTVRKAAAKFGISKSTVHKDVTERLKHISPSLYREVGLVLEQNKQERHFRGGEATRRKYMQKREISQTSAEKQTKN
ncbi:MAG: sporulation transcriptional regulator SpoIIID [Clostridia bacterium]|nr:sporulation transcriptional regulator SpoIIID [Clostridia bacterium]